MKLTPIQPFSLACNRLCRVVSVAVLTIMTVVSNGQVLTDGSNLSYVDPSIGSVGLILEPTRPLTHLPHSMTRMYPGRRDQLDDQIAWFPLTISSHRQPAVFGLMPFTGMVSESAYGKKFTYDFEHAAPFEYNVLLDENNTGVQFAPAAHSGFFHFVFEATADHFLRMSILNKEGSIELIDKRSFSGTELVTGKMQDQAITKMYFYAETDVNLDTIYYKDRRQKKDALISVAAGTKNINIRYGISFISIEQAKINLSKEISHWNIKTVSNDAKNTWNKSLNRMEVKGGTTDQKKVFYTAFYRTLERMVDINEYGHYFSAYDGKVHASDQPFYIDNWVWDSHIAHEPLMTILEPGMQALKIRSYIDMYVQSGRMPTFALATGHASMMNGNHFAPIVSDAWFKGIRNFDVKKVYEGLKQNSLLTTKLPDTHGPLTSLDSFYNDNGYMPALYPGEKETVKGVNPVMRRQAISVTLENSYDDWCIAQLSTYAGYEKDKNLFLKRAMNYKNIFRTDKGFMWPKDTAGKWIEPFDPKFSGGQAGRDYTTENNVYTYNWSVKQDINGLMDLMGGKAAAEQKLDELFRADVDRYKFEYWNIFPDATGLVGQFSMGNEPSFHIPYLYNYTGAPWKTQKRIRTLLDEWFPPTIFGIPGDEDGGGMSAFVVFSMMGFFPVTPGMPVYNIGSPVFSEVIIHQPNGKDFTIKAINNSAENKYIQGALLNGQTWNKAWFKHTDLVNGGTLQLEMGNRPNKKWGSDISMLPPDTQTINPSE